MFTIDYESVNGGIYRSRTQATTLGDAQRFVREHFREVDCYHQVFIADAATDRRVRHGVRGHRSGWVFVPVEPLTRDDMDTRLTGLTRSGAASLVIIAGLGERGEYRFTRTDDYGPLTWRARRYEDGTYALDKLPSEPGDSGRDDIADAATLSRIESSACDR